MANSTNGNGKPDEGINLQPQPVKVSVAAQYIKDLSFENPNIEKLMQDPGDQPNLQLMINVGAKNVGPNMYESAIDFDAQATNKHGKIYQLQLVYAGLFRIENIPESALEPFLLVNCPSILFPFVRRLAADLTREGGFPPLLLDPFDFTQLYMARQKEKHAKSGEGESQVKN
ncbi:MULTISPECIES: protein-export chaperone SecB [Hyphomicrobium]|uniref:Protein-export protein SecB n=1 Tax=Hyphomicrobium sulfonivorans TaxID=121290 RepID=A0A109BCN5_HYPSL|nr:MULTISPECIES: protein-export chaperone SecB [Hyphomicrobium]KWT66364.1 Protein export cytoplasm chaperone protein [Hyphomicrobium sulfonivorans]MDH4983389.1 protein-export chaperone SecB [Hyphomicrobium sp. D-2]